MKFIAKIYHSNIIIKAKVLYVSVIVCVYVKCLLFRHAASTQNRFGFV